MVEVCKEDTIEIGKVDNGYVIKRNFWDDTSEDGQRVIGSDEEVIEEKEGEHADKEALVNLLYKLAEHLGFSYDKWSDKNLEINFNKKGSKID